MQSNNLIFNVKINGLPLKEYFHEGNTFIEGREGSKFSINIQNYRNLKMKAVISVDGLSIIDGDEAGLNSGGYVIDPYSEGNYSGWRTSDQTINEFFFSSKKKSYNKRTDQNSKNIGVIGVMIFNEIVINYPISSTTGAWYGSGIDTGSAIPRGPISICSASNQGASNNIGTGFGNEVKSTAYKDYTKFENNPSEIMCIYYDDVKGLEKRGIIVDPYKSMPNAFPSYLTRDRYAKRPIK